MTEPQSKSATWSKYSNVDQDGDPNAFVRHMDALSGMEDIQAYKNKTFELPQIHEGAQILEAGCGPGTDAQSMAKLVGASGLVTGVDKSETMIAEARERTKGLVLPLEYQVGDLYKLRFEDDSFDGCRADRVFHHLDEPEVALAEVVRVVRPGGRIVLFEPDFDTMIIDSPDRVVTRKVLQQRADQYPNGWCGRQLFGLYRRQGLVDIRILAQTVITHSFDVADKQFFGLQDAAALQVQAGQLSERQVEQWVMQMEEANRRGEFFAAITAFLAYGRKPV